MRARARGESCWVFVAMLAAAAGGRVLDAQSLLPWVREAPAVRGGSAAWVAAVGAAALVAVAARRRWSRTQSLRATAAVVLPGQLAVFFAAEAVVRMASGRGPIDPDGLLGACLQAALAMTLLLALTVAWAVALRVAPLQPTAPGAAREPRPVRAATGPRTSPWLALLARGPPRTAGT